MSAVQISVFFSFRKTHQRYVKFGPCPGFASWFEDLNCSLIKVKKQTKKYIYIERENIKLISLHIVVYNHYIISPLYIYMLLVIQY